MSYIPPLGNGVELGFSGEVYTPPLGGDIELVWRIPRVFGAARSVGQPVVAATGTFTTVGFGDMVVAPVLDGSGSQTILGRGQTIVQPIVVGSFEDNAYGEGSITGRPSVTGIGWVPVFGTGYIAASAFISGVGWRHFSIYGNVIAQPIVSNDPNAISIAGTGSITAEPVIYGSAQYTAAFTAQGSVVAAPVVAGTMQHKIVGLGSITTSPIVVGMGGIPTILGTGVITPNALVTGVGARGVAAQGEIVIDSIVFGSFYRDFDGGSLVSVHPFMIASGIFTNVYKPCRIFGRAVSTVNVAGIGHV